MESVAVKTLQLNTEYLIARAKAGEIITITEDGEPVARLMPIAKDAYQELIDAGLIIPASRPFSERQPPLEGRDYSLADEIIRARREERF
jgi:prevent-host-death family protein